MSVKMQIIDLAQIYWKNEEQFQSLLILNWFINFHTPINNNLATLTQNRLLNLKIGA